MEDGAAVDDPTGSAKETEAGGPVDQQDAARAAMDEPSRTQGQQQAEEEGMDRR